MARLYGGNDILLEQWCHIEGKIYNNYVAFSLHFYTIPRILFAKPYTIPRIFIPAISARVLPLPD